MGFLLQAATTITDTAAQLASTTQAVEPEKSIRYIELLFKGGIMMIPLLILSMMAIGFIIERYLFIRQRTKINKSLVINVVDKLYSGNIEAAKTLCVQDNSSLGNVLEAGISQLGKPIDHIEKALETQSNIELSEMERRMGYINMISGIAPRLGFIGTILGVIKIFYNISQTADISIGTISGGLYEKMISSGTGLIVGVLAFLGYHFLLNKVDSYTLYLQKEVFEFLKGIQKPVNK
jgi:biopolymer transport protein ExbB